MSSALLDPLAVQRTETYNLPPMKLCGYLGPVVAQNLVVITAFLAVLMVVRLVQRRPLFTWRDVVALSLILIWAFYFRNSMHPIFQWKDIFGNKSTLHIGIGT